MIKITNNTWVGQDLLEFLNRVLVLQYPEVYFLVDTNTRKHCLPLVVENLSSIYSHHIIEVEAGETHKNLEVAVTIWRTLSQYGATRKNLLINVGGGMITDMGGFVASTYQRGMPFINLPTSLLGMVDAAIGGKTAIDFEGAKNLVGTFSNAMATLIYPPFLESLPQRELLSGFAEVVKHGILDGKKTLNQILDFWNEKDYESLISTTCKLKADIVARDFKENNLRKILNFGHTLGHAVESYFLDKGQPILHGEAVAAGIMMESWLSHMFSTLSLDDFNYIKNLIAAYFPKLHWPEKDDISILYWLQFDKKNDGQNQQYALLDRVGYCTHGHEIPIEASAQALAQYRNWANGQ